MYKQSWSSSPTGDKKKKKRKIVSDQNHWKKKKEIIWKKGGLWAYDTSVSVLVFFHLIFFDCYSVLLIYYIRLLSISSLSPSFPSTTVQCTWTGLHFEGQTPRASTTDGGSNLLEHFEATNILELSPSTLDRIRRNWLKKCVNLPCSWSCSLPLLDTQRPERYKAALQGISKTRWKGGIQWLI